MDPKEAVESGYVFVDLVLEDWPLQFGRRGSRGWWGMVTKLQQRTRREKRREHQRR